MKKKWLFKIIYVVIFCFSVFVIWYVHFNDQRWINIRPSVQEYVPGQWNIKGSVDTQKYLEIDKRLEIGAAVDGMAVFKNPHAAYDALIEKYSGAIEIIRKHYNLNELTRTDYRMYKVYGWQVPENMYDKKLWEETFFISGFFDIYENSFELD